MPNYDFKCRECHALTEKLTRWDVKSIRCVTCGKSADRTPQVTVEDCQPLGRLL